MNRLKALDKSIQNLMRVYELQKINKDEEIVLFLRVSTIKCFELCFELSWKNIKDVCIFSGIECTNSPRYILKIAYSESWLENIDIWLEYLELKNKASHIYNEKIINEIINNITSFLINIQNLRNKLLLILTT